METSKSFFLIFNLYTKEFEGNSGVQEKKPKDLHHILSPKVRGYLRLAKMDPLDKQTVLNPFNLMLTCLNLV